MIRLLLIVSMLWAVPVWAQDDTPDLQKQIASLIAARGEDQKAIAELRSQVAALKAAAPVETDKDRVKRAIRPLEESCKVIGRKLGDVVMSFSPQIKVESFVCKD